MVNPVNYIGTMAADLAPKSGSGAAGASVKPQIEVEKPKMSTTQIEQKAELKLATSGAMPQVSSQPLVPPLTSLALWKDGDSGMQVAVVRDRVSGQVVDQFPTERALRLAAMVRQQQAIAEQFQRESQIKGVNLTT